MFCNLEKGFFFLFFLHLYCFILEYHYKNNKHSHFLLKNQTLKIKTLIHVKCLYSIVESYHRKSMTLAFVRTIFIIIELICIYFKILANFLKWKKNQNNQLDSYIMFTYLSRKSHSHQNKRGTTQCWSIPIRMMWLEQPKWKATYIRPCFLLQIQLLSIGELQVLWKYVINHIIFFGRNPCSHEKWNKCHCMVIKVRFITPKIGECLTAID